MSATFTVFHDKQFQNIDVSHASTVLGTSLIMPILSVFLQYKGFSETQIGLIMGVTAASSLLVRPWVGVSVDTRGSRWAILIGQGLLFVSMLGYLLASRFVEFFLLRLLFGIGNAFYGTGSVTFASSIGKGELRASAIAMFTMITMLGLGASMGFAQLAFESFGFYALIIASLGFITLAFLFMKLRARAILPVASKNRASFMAVLKSPIVLATTISQFAAAFAFSGLFTFIPLASLEQNIHFYSLFFITFAIFVISSRFYVQKANHFFGLKQTVIYASLAMLFSVLLFFLGISQMVLIIAGGLFGIGFGVIYPTLVLILIQKIPESNRGTGLSIIAASSDIGNAISTAILGVVAEHFGYPVLFFSLALILSMGTYGFFLILDLNRLQPHNFKKDL